MTNIRRHAAAGRAALTLSYMDDLVTFDVRDDGVGFQGDAVACEATPDGGFGLRNLRERVQHLGGNVVVESTPGEGTAVVVEVPA